MSRTVYFSISVLIIATIAYFVQSMFILNGDVASLLFDTQLFLAGGTYVKDFFETNPPMIFIIYSPASLFAQLTSTTITPVIRIYIILLALLSITCCSVLLKKIIKEKDNSLRYTLLYTLLFIFLFMTVGEFGQREHLLVILMFPYLFAAVVNIQNQRINPLLAILIGSMAALGFGLKPYFLLTIVLIELYTIIMKRNWLGWVRIEAVACAGLLVSYLIFIFLYQPNYIHIMLPLISHFYFSGIQQPWFDIFSQLNSIFCFTAFAYYFFFYDKKYYETLSRVLILALTGMIFAFLITQTAWSYHVFPALCLAITLITLYVFSFFSNEISHHSLCKKERLFLVSAAFIVPLSIFIMELENATFLTRSFHTSSLVKYIQQHPEEHKIYCFSSYTTGFCFPLVYMTQHEFSGRFPFFWWVRGLIKLEQNSPQGLPDSLQKEKNFFLDAIADDLNHYQPNLITINVGKDTLVLTDHFDYIAYFSQNEAFRNAWKQYHFVGKMGDYLTYQRDHNISLSMQAPSMNHIFIKK